MSAKKKDDVVKPQVIDLEAAAVTDLDDAAPKKQPEPETPETAPEPSPRPASAQRSSATFTLPAAALLAGLIGGGWLYRDVLASYFPTDQLTALQQSVASLQTALGQSELNLKALSDGSGASLAALQSSLDAQKKDVAARSTALADRVTTVEQQAAQLSDAMAKLKAMPSTQVQGSAGDPAVLSELQQRIATLEAEVAALKQQTPMSNPLAKGFAAFASLHGRIDKGEPYASELASLSSAIHGMEIPAAMTESAPTGVPSPKALADELRALAPSLAVASGGDDAATGYWASIKQALKGLVSIKSAGATDWQAIAVSAADLVDQGKLPDAVELLKNSGAPPDALSAWVTKAEARQAVDIALARLSNTIMQQVTTP